MKIRGFNLVPGAVFVTNRGPAVAIEVDRDSDAEVVTVWARVQFAGVRESFSFDYCEPVEIVGLCVNPDDDGDDDFGV